MFIIIHYFNNNQITAVNWITPKGSRRPQNYPNINQIELKSKGHEDHKFIFFRIKSIESN